MDHSKLMNNETILSSSLPTPAQTTIEVILERAKLGRTGVFWSLATTYRELNSAIYQPSLAYGSAGILLTLLEYFRNTKDKEVSDLIVKGAECLIDHLKKTPFQHGFYAGTAGLLYALKEISEIFPEITVDCDTKFRDFLKTEADNSVVSSNLETGVAGTLIGLLTLSKDQAFVEADLFQPLLKKLISQTKPHPEGVIWDFNPTSIKPPVGFIYGNAGIDYCLGHLRNRTGISFRSLVSGSLSYANSLYDDSTGNWKDQDVAMHLKKILPSDIDQALNKGSIDKLIPDQTDLKSLDSISWGTGTAGILLSRLMLATSSGNASDKEMTKSDCIKAIHRILKSSDAETSDLDTSIFRGLPGIMLTLESCKNMLSTLGDFPIQNFLESANNILSNQTPILENEDLSLFTGMAGATYTQLKTLNHTAHSNFLNPLSMLIASEKPNEEGDLTPFLERCLPLSSRNPGLISSVSRGPINLKEISVSVTEGSVDKIDSVALAAAQHELTIFEDLSKIHFQKRFWEEMLKQRRYVLNYGEGMDDNIIFDNFLLDESVSIMELDFDPYESSLGKTEKPTCLLRKLSSKGVFEVKISQLQYSILLEFQTPDTTIAVIKRLVNRVENPNVTQQQLATLILKMMRGFIAEGHLCPSSSSSIHRSINKIKFKKTRKYLLPKE